MTQSFKVIREVLFDRMYLTGETYEGNPTEVAHLVANGVLEPIDGKAESASKNKVDKASKNKVDKAPVSEPEPTPEPEPAPEPTPEPEPEAGENG